MLAAVFFLAEIFIFTVPLPLAFGLVILALAMDLAGRTDAFMSHSLGLFTAGQAEVFWLFTRGEKCCPESYFAAFSLNRLNKRNGGTEEDTYSGKFSAFTSVPPFLLFNFLFERN